MDTTTTTAIIITAAVTLIICAIIYKLIRMVARIFTGGKSVKVSKVFRDIDLLADAVENGEVKLGPEVRAMMTDVFKRVDKFMVDISDEAEADYIAELHEPLERITGRK